MTPRLLEFEREYDVTANVRPVYPIAVRIDGFFKTTNPLWRSYLLRDVARTAQMLGMPYSLPNPDPIVMNLQTGDVPKSQPYISRLTRLGVAAADRAVEQNPANHPRLERLIRVMPDVQIDNTPADFLAGHDRQVEAAVELLKSEMK